MMIYHQIYLTGFFIVNFYSFNMSKISSKFSINSFHLNRINWTKIKSIYAHINITVDGDSLGI